jgi:hypothetical protein
VYRTPSTRPRICVLERCAQRRRYCRLPSRLVARASKLSPCASWGRRGRRRGRGCPACGGHLRARSPGSPGPAGGRS